MASNFKNLLVNGKNNITAGKNFLSNVQSNLANKTNATNVNATPNLPTRPTVNSTNLNLVKAQQPVQTKLNNLNTQTQPTNNIGPAKINGQPITEQTQMSRFIGFQNNNNNGLSTDLAGNIVGRNGNILNTAQQGKSFAVENSKPILNIPTKASEIKAENEKYDKEYKERENLIKQLHWDIKNANGQLTREDITKKYKQWKGKEDAVLQLQADLRPLIQQGQYGNMQDIQKYYPELLQAKKQADKTVLKEQEAESKKIQDAKKRADKLLNSNNSLSQYGTKYLQDVSEVAGYLDYIRNNYRLANNPSDSDILAWGQENIPELKELLNDMQQLENIGGMTNRDWDIIHKNGFDIGEWFGDATNWVQNKVQNWNETVDNGTASRWLNQNLNINMGAADTLLGVSEIPGNMVSSLMGGIDRATTSIGRLSSGQSAADNSIAKDIIRTGGGVLETAFNTVWAIPTAVFELANQTPIGKELTDATLGNLQQKLDNLQSGKTTNSDNQFTQWYNGLDEQTKADLLNEEIVAILRIVHKGGSKVKKLGEFEINAAKEAINDLITEKYVIDTNSATFRAKVEQGLADGTMKVSDDGFLTDVKGNNIGKVKVRKVSTGDGMTKGEKIKYVVDKIISINRAAWNARSLGELNPNALPDNRTIKEKAQSQINQAKENITEGIEGVKEGVNNIVDTAKQGINKAKNVANRIEIAPGKVGEVFDNMKNKVTSKRPTSQKSEMQEQQQGLKEQSLEQEQAGQNNGELKITNDTQKIEKSKTGGTLSEKVYDKLTGLDEATRERMKANPYSAEENKNLIDTMESDTAFDFNEYQTNRYQNVLDTIVDKLEQKENTRKNEVGPLYQKLEETNAPIDTTNIKNQSTKFRDKVAENDGIISSSEQTKINKLLDAVDSLGDGTTDIWKIRRMADQWAKWDTESTTDGIRLIREIRDAIDDEIRVQRPEMKEVDTEYRRIKDEIADLRGNLINKKSGKLRDNAVSTVKNLLNPTNKQFLERLEKEIPGITKQLQAIRDSKFVYNAYQTGNGSRFISGIARGTLGNMFKAVGVVTGGIPGLLFGALLDKAVDTALVSLTRKALKATITEMTPKAQAELESIMKKVQEGKELTAKEKAKLKEIENKIVENAENAKKTKAEQEAWDNFLDRVKKDAKSLKLPNRGGTDGGKNILTNGKTIITDAKGNSKVKGQISEIDNRPKTEAPKEQPKNNLTKKEKLPKDMTPEERKAYNEKVKKQIQEKADTKAREIMADKEKALDKKAKELAREYRRYSEEVKAEVDKWYKDNGYEVNDYTGRTFSRDEQEVAEGDGLYNYSDIISVEKGGDTVRMEQPLIMKDGEIISRGKYYIEKKSDVDKRSTAYKGLSETKEQPKNKITNKTPKKKSESKPKAESKPQRITAPKKERQIIKNNKGENEIVYHGTNAKFDKFDKNFIGRGGGFRFTTSKGEAEGYGKNVKEYNLMASNIMDFDSPEFDDLATQIIKQYTREKFGEEFYISPEAFIQDEGLRNYAQELGYDALKFSKGGDTKYIVYNEDQIIPVQKQPKAKATKTSKNKVTNPSKAKTTSLFNENEVDKGNKSEGLNPDALPLSDYREIQRLTDGKFYSLGDSLKRGKLNTYMATKITTDLVGNYDEIIADEFDPENLEDEWVEKYNEVIDMYDAYEKGEIEEANGYADELVKGKTAKELIDQYTPEYESDLKIYNRLSKKYPGFANGKIDLTGEQGRAMREFASQENETSQDIDYQELAEQENETPQIVDVDEGVDITTQLIDEFNNLKPGEFKWIGDNREAGVRKTFGDANIKVPGEEDSVDIYFMPGDSGDRMNINLHDTSNLGIRNANEILSKLDIQYRIGSELDERNETKYFLENKLTHSKAYFDKNGASWLSVNKTLRGKEIVPRRNAEEQAEYNMQMEQRRAEIEAEREQDRIKAEERKAEEERQQEIDKQMKANLLRYVDIKHNDNPLGRGRTLKDLSEKNSEANNRIRYYGDDVADDAGVWQVLDVLADKNGKIREVWESDSKSSYSYEYYDEELGRNNNISGLNKTQRDYLEYRIKASQTEKRVNNHLDKIENKSLKTRVENKLNEMKKWQDDNGKTQYGTDAQYIDYLVLDKGFTPKEFPTGKTYANGEPKIDYMIVNEKNVGYISSKIENDYARSILETPEEELSAEDEAKLDELFTPKTTTEVTGEKNAVTAKQTENEKPKNLVTNRIENTKQEIQEIDKDTYFDDIVKNLKDHPREMFIYKDGNYFYPHYILPSGKVITPENTYWGEVSSEEAARNWLLKEAEEHSEENETKKAEKLKEIVGKTAEKYEATLKRIESDNPMQEIWTSGDYFKYGMGNNQMARAKKESEANAEVGTFKKDVIDGKEGYRIFVAGTKNEAIRAFYEPKTGKTYRIYRGPIIDDSKPYTTKQVERIEKFLQNVDKQLDKETKKEKKEEKQVITQERLDSLKPDKDGVIELDYKGDERWALGKGKEALIKEGKADGKYLYNYGGAAHPQYMALYIKNGIVYEGRKGLEDQYMTTKQEAVDWLNQKEKDVEHESTERYTQTDYETLPKTISVETEAEKAGPKRIAPDRVKRQQETYDQGLESVKNVLKQSPVKIYELGFKSDRSKAVQNILEERKRIRQLPETEAEKQWNELAKSVYEDLVIKDISKGYRYPEDVTSKFPKAQMKKAVDARARYEKGLFTSFSAKDTRANNQYRDEIGAGIKSQDGKPVTQEQMQEIVDGIRAYSNIFGVDMKKFAEDNNVIYVHLHGGNPFLMGGMSIAGLYRRDAAGNISVSLGGREGVMEKGEDGKMKKSDIKTTTVHEITHAVDGMLEGKLFSDADTEILKKTMNKPSELINYYNRKQEIVARAVEQYAAHQLGKKLYRTALANIDWENGSVEFVEKEANYVDREAYWNQENFDKYVKPIVEKNKKEKLKDYMIQQPKNNVLSNDKNKVTTQAARTSRPSIRMNVEEREKKNATANPMNKVTNKILKETKSELKELKHTISDNNIRSLQQKRKAGIGDNAEVYRGKINKRTKEVLDEMGIKGYFELVVEQNDINHLLNRHENNGKYSVTRDDVQNIPEIMLNADSIRAGGKTKTQGMNTIIFEKTIGDVKYVIAAHVGRKNKKVGPHTMRKKKA